MIKSETKKKVTVKQNLQPKCPSTDEWIIKCGISTQGNVSQEKNEVLIDVTTCLKTLLSEGSLSQEDIIAYDSIYMKSPEEANPQRPKVD